MAAQRLLNRVKTTTTSEEEAREDKSMTYVAHDDRHRELLFLGAPKRVVSLVPSDTHTVAALGCGDSLIGRTDYCVGASPLTPTAQLIAKVSSVGGTKNPRIDEIVACNPDLILANQEENSRRDLEQLAQLGFRIFISFPRRVADGLAHFARLARIFHVSNDAAVREHMRAGYTAFRTAEAARRDEVPLRAFCPIWHDPLMTIHGSTYISDMLDLVGLQNVFADRERRYPLAADHALGRALVENRGMVAPAILLDGTTEGRDVRYPRVLAEEVVARSPEVIVLPSEPHAFTEAEVARFATLDTPASKPGRIVQWDGEDLSWPGERTGGAIERLRAQVAALRAMS